ncbi:MAG: rsbT [Firmicutes bacterium]|nr:rsbT [Bacillota bacterium]
MKYRKVTDNENIISFKKLDTRTFKLLQPIDNEAVVIMTRKLAKNAGFQLTDEVMIATAASELATNILRYAQQGEITVTIIQINDTHQTGIEIYAQDQGPGIRDLQMAMKDNYSTSKMSLGMGLPSVERIMDEFEIESELGHGTRVLTRKWC